MPECLVTCVCSDSRGGRFDGMNAQFPNQQTANKSLLATRGHRHVLDWLCTKFCDGGELTGRLALAGNSI